MNRILAEEWDPIGVMKMNAACAYTEYADYAMGIAKAISEDVEVGIVAEYLTHLREVRMCCPADCESDQQVAELLVSLK